MNKTITLSIPMMLAFSATNAFATDVNYYVIAKQAAPFQIEENNTQHSGIVTDIVKKVFENSEYHINYHSYPFNRMITLLEAGGEHNWITYGSPSWGGVQAENLSAEPIYTVKHVLLSSNKNAIEFKNMDDMKDKVVVLLHGFDYPQLVPYISKGEVEELRVKDYQAAFRIIKKLQGDAGFVEMASRIKYNLDKQGLDSKSYKTQSFSKVIPDYPIYLAFDPKMDKTLQTFINQRLEKLRASGDLDSIINKYI
ncbi:amino acid ABC transporter [Photobacterium jeanii]|uniref:Amino acid ABC transporter n=1 Tax=Photobacterium jeanii TaxID=858640 RepID=A0A178K2J8_9GAMM|nr:transporter substrate-binding domain-containing protein [Photobacterium jeanii]OAN11529.1 amino acid ABC transporter [Photobacterium jeanii]PST91048.1 amino acid ABC transporter [Photobacterium jeanii]